MGRSVSAVKTGEDKKFVYYDYDFKTVVDGKLETVVGKILIDKITGEVHFELAPGDNGSMGAAAVTAIVRDWVKSGKIAFPDKSAFQS
jgi:hypothetical protein